MNADTWPPTRPSRNTTNDVVIMVVIAVAVYVFVGQFVILPAFVMWLMCAAGAAAVSHNKWLSPVHGFAVGMLLGPIGLLIAIFQRSGVPTAPPVPQGVVAPGPVPTVSVDCPQCETSNRVPVSASRFECGRCGTVSDRPLRGA